LFYQSNQFMIKNQFVIIFILAVFLVQGQQAIEKFKVEKDESLAFVDIKHQPNHPNSNEMGDDGQPKEGACIIFRIPVNGKKINYLEDKLKHLNKGDKSYDSVKETLENTYNENLDYFHILREGFNEYFDAAKVYFLPDSSYNSFLKGQPYNFLNDSGQPDPSIKCDEKNFYFIITGKDKEQLLFVDKNLNPLDKPFPYKKNTFMPAFKKILNRQLFINNQIRYFNEKLMFIL